TASDLHPRRPRLQAGHAPRAGSRRPRGSRHAPRRAQSRCRVKFDISLAQGEWDGAISARHPPRETRDRRAACPATQHFHRPSELHQPGGNVTMTVQSTNSATGVTPPRILDLPIGLTATGTRQEFDSLGTVEVPANHYWGAQTQRSLLHFDIGHDRMPKEV